MSTRSTIPTGHLPGSFAQELKAPISDAAEAPATFLIALALEAARPSEDPALLVAKLLQLQAPNVDGSVTRQVGFGAWGVEEGVQILTTTVHRGELFRALQWILRTENQTCAYVEIDGEPFELAVSGAMNPIEGTV